MRDSDIFSVVASTVALGVALVALIFGLLPKDKGMSADATAEQTFRAATQENPLNPTIIDGLKIQSSVKGNFAVVILKAKVGTGTGRQNITLRIRMQKTPWQVIDIKRIKDWKAE